MTINDYLTHTNTHHTPNRSHTLDQHLQFFNGPSIDL